MTDLKKLLYIPYVMSLIGVACAPKAETPAKQNSVHGSAVTVRAQGTDSSGGGDSIIRSSTSEQVLSIIEKIKIRLPMEFDRFVVEDLPTIKTARLKEVLGAMVAGGQANSNFPAWKVDTEVSLLIRKAKFHIEEHGPCQHAGEDSDASTENRKGAEICFSLPRLRQVPPEALYPQIMALAAHEFAHQFGFGESEAHEVQSYFLEEVLTNKAFLRNTIKRALSAALTELESTRTADSASLCTKLQEVTKAIEWLGQLIIGLGHEVSTSSPPTYAAISHRRIAPIADEVKKLRANTCAPDTFPDKAAAAQHLDKVEESLSHLKSSLIEELFPRRL